MKPQRLPASGRPLWRFGTWPLLALVLAVGQSGCCCFECYEHCVAPIKIIPPKSALEPRNPPCSYVDPMCYGFHATCWRAWPAECNNLRDCAEWYQQDVIPYPGKDSFVPPMAPLPEAPLPAEPTPAEPAPPEPQASIRSFLPEPPLSEPQFPVAQSESVEPPVQLVSDYAALPPIVRPNDLPASMPLDQQDTRGYSSRRTAAERQLSELP